MMLLDDEGRGLDFLASEMTALVTANSRTYRAERRARAGLETLINTSPVGVVVFDGCSGATVSINREAMLIVENTWSPWQIG